MTTAWDPAALDAECAAERAQRQRRNDLADLAASDPLVAQTRLAARLSSDRRRTRAVLVVHPGGVVVERARERFVLRATPPRPLTLAAAALVAVFALGLAVAFALGGDWTAAGVAVLGGVYVGHVLEEARGGR